MTARRWAYLGAAFVAVTLVASSLGLLTGLAIAPAGTGSTVAAAGSPATSGTAATALHAPSGASSTSDSGGSTAADLAGSPVYGIAQAESAIAQHELNRSGVLFPRAPAQGQVPTPGGEVVGPAYTGVPAPMGLADVGQGTTGSYTYTTDGFNGTIHVNSFDDYNPGLAPYASAPDWMTFQLNTVTDNTSYPGHTNGDFWIQNVAHYNGTSLQLEDNIWNFSSTATCVEAGTILSGSGQLSGCIYYVYGPTYTVTAPFTLALYSNITLVSGLGGLVPEVTFSYAIHDSGGTLHGTYDTVTFNGLGSDAAPPQFEVNGNTLTPTGYTMWDAELILGGNGGGTNAVLQSINATAQLEYLNRTSQYVSIPSAYDYGADTGETSYGVAATYSGTTENLTTGPSLLNGLWNTKNGAWGNAGTTTTWTVHVTGLPDYAFAFLQNHTTYTEGLPSLSYWPASVTGVLTTTVPALTGTNSYSLVVYANGYTTGIFSITGSVTLTETLTANTAVFDTPVYLSTTAQASAFGESGVAGVQAKGGNLWINDTESTIAAPFRLMNDYAVPTFFLFAELDLSTNVNLTAFVQSPTTFNYTTSGSSTETFLPGWTQGYYFNYGSGRFSVADTSVLGNSSRYYSSNGADIPVVAVEFWWTFHSNVSNIVTSQDIYGVDFYFGSGSSAFNVSASSGAYGLIDHGAPDVRGVDLHAAGADQGGEESIAADVETVTGSTFDGISAGAGATALVVTGSSTDVFSNLNVVHGDPGSVTTSTSLSFEGVSVNGTTDAFLIDGCTRCSATDVSSVNGTGIEFEASTFTSVSGVTASNGGVGLLSDGSTVLNVTNVAATSGSVGAYVEGTHTVRATDLSASDQSVGFAAEGSLGLTLTDLSVTSGSLGLWSVDNDWTNLTTYNATESAPTAGYFSSPLGLAPTAAVFGDGDQNTTLTSGIATEFAYGVVSNDSNHLTVSNLAEIGGTYGIALTGTESTTILDALLYGNQIGLWANGTTGLTVEVSTIEASTSYGLWVDNGASTVVGASNFVGNNGASTDGTYSAAHLQAGVSGTTAIQFNYGGIDNFWSDWNSSVGPYTIAPGISDPAPLAAFYEHWLAFPETGLPTGTVWGITLDGRSYVSGLPVVIIPSYTLGDPELAFSVVAPSMFHATPASGAVDYTGANVTVPISFVQFSYLVTFAESGLASKASWSVTLAGTTRSNTTSTISFTETAGTYSFSVSATGYTVSPSSGSVVVTTSDQTINVTFTPVPTYRVTFTETGLAAGTNWSVTLNGTAQNSTTTSIVFSEPNGAYGYAVGTVTNYTAAPASGSVTVASAAQSVAVTFTAIPAPTYSLVFTETGLPSGTNWNVTVSGQTLSSTTATITFSLPAGSYTYGVASSASDYTATPSSGTVIVTSSGASVSISFQSTSPPPPAHNSTSHLLLGLSTVDWAIIGIVIAVIVAGLVALFLVRRRGGSSSKGPPQTES